MRRKRCPVAVGAVAHQEVIRAIDTVGKATLQYEQAGGLQRKGAAAAAAPAEVPSAATSGASAARSRVTDAVGQKLSTLFERSKDARAALAKQISHLIAIAGTQGVMHFHVTHAPAARLPRCVNECHRSPLCTPCAWKLETYSARRRPDGVAAPLRAGMRMSVMHEHGSALLLRRAEGCTGPQGGHAMHVIVMIMLQR